MLNPSSMAFWSVASLLVHVLIITGVSFKDAPHESLLPKPSGVAIKLFSESEKRSPQPGRVETTPKGPETKKTVMSKIKKPKRSKNDTRSPGIDKFLKGRENQKTILSYVEQLKAYLEQNKVYPRMAIKLRHSGIVKVRLKIGISGKFDEIKVISPSPFNTLNRAAVNLFESLGHFKPLPEKFDDGEEFIVPIIYNLKGES